jgi:hypothetical protein
MLIKSVINARRRRLIVVILRLLKIQVYYYMWLIINALDAICVFSDMDSVFLHGAKKNKL